MMSPMSKSLRVLLPALLSMGLVLGACSSGENVPVNSASDTGSSSTVHPAAVVTLKFVSFEPGRVTIHAGQTVEWVWDDAPVAYNVVFDDFSSPTQVSGVYFHTFDTSGVYTYQCTEHATMRGTVDVLP